MRVRLTNRDRAIFKFILENKYVTTEQVHKALFQNGSQNTPRNRLSELFLAGYLSKIKSRFVYFRLTRRALKEILDSQDEIKSYLQMRTHENQLIHDRYVTDCKLLIAPSSIIRNWVPAHLLKKKSFHQFRYEDHQRVNVPDALFEMTMGGTYKKIAFEFERRLKKKQRYLDLLEKYYTIIPVDFVFYVTYDEAIKKAILALGRQKIDELSRCGIASGNKLYVTTFDDLKNKGRSAIFEGVTGRGFTIEQHEKLMPPTPDTSDKKPRYSIGTFGKAS